MVNRTESLGYMHLLNLKQILKGCWLKYSQGMWDLYLTRVKWILKCCLVQRRSEWGNCWQKIVNLRKCLSKQDSSARSQPCSSRSFPSASFTFVFAVCWLPKTMFPLQCVCVLALEVVALALLFSLLWVFAVGFKVDYILVFKKLSFSNILGSFKEWAYFLWTE